MELTKEAINKCTDVIPGISGYNLIIDKIEENIPENPDISIESCKSLIEGLSKKILSLLSEDYKTSKSFRKNCDNKYNFLIEHAFKLLLMPSVEVKLNETLSTLVLNASLANKFNKFKDSAKEIVSENNIDAAVKISALRDERGDISHGRDYPKSKESGVQLAKSVMSITDGISSYLIYQLKKTLLEREDTDFVYSEYPDYNEWIDEVFKFPFLLKTGKFSKILYDNYKGEYKRIYHDEYKPQVEAAAAAEEEEEEQNKDFAKQVLDKLKPDISLGTVNFPYQLEIENKEKIELLKQFAKNENLNWEILIKVINDYFFTENRPLKDDVIEVMNEKPSLKERESVVKPLIEKIIEFANSLI